MKLKLQIIQKTCSDIQVSIKTVCAIAVMAHKPEISVRCAVFKSMLCKRNFFSVALVIGGLALQLLKAAKHH